MNILVTGGAGFIGSHLIDLLIENGTNNVFCIDDLSGGFIENVNKLAFFTQIDLRNPQDTQNIINRIKPDIIYHLAADAAEGRSQFVPISCTQRNYLSFLNLIVPAIKNGVKKIVVVSSMSVYGSQQVPFTEDQLPKPEDIYGINKFSMEKSTEILSKVYGFDYVIIRPHNVYGPRQNLQDPYRNVVAIFINCLLNNKGYYIYGDGNQKRAFTFIDDCVPYIYKAGLAEQANSKIFNIGSNNFYTINQLSDYILKTFFGNSIPKKLMPKYLELRPQEVVEAYCDHQNASKILGFEEKTSLKDGIEIMIDWAKTIGGQKPKYLKELELENKKLPLTWKNKLI